MNKTAKQTWIDRLCMKRAGGSYTKDEVTAYRRHLEDKYRLVDEQEFRRALKGNR